VVVRKRPNIRPPTPPAGDEIQRILNIPMLQGGVGNPAWDAPDMTATFRKPGGTMQLSRVQSQALWEARMAFGLIAAVGVGHGKTLMTTCLPNMFPEVERWLLLIPAAMREPFWREWRKYEPHFRMPQNLVVESYESFSAKKNADMLFRLQPDAIMADEVHLLSNRDSARTKRVLEYYKHHPEVLFFGLSGTILDKSIKEIAHLFDLAFRGRNPYPRSKSLMKSWASLLDVDGIPQSYDWGRVRKAYQALWPSGPVMPDDDIEVARKLFRVATNHRMAHTAGFVATSDASVGASLNIHLVSKIKVPESLKGLMDNVRATWELFDFVIPDAQTLSRKLRELVAGYYYEPVWPNGVRNEAWLFARNEWNSATREYLSRYSRRGLDSQSLVEEACSRGRIPHTERVFRAWSAWQDLKHLDPPVNRIVWVDPYLVHWSLKWLDRQKQPALIWWRSQAYQEAYKRNGIPTYGRGDDIPEDVAHDAAVSLNVHYQGRNLQKWHNQLVVEMSSQGKRWEQLLGRTHRRGQQSDEVLCTVVQHDRAYREALATAVARSAFMQDQTKNRQKLLMASWVTDNDALFPDILNPNLTLSPLDLRRSA
jgi:hypothetical protein